MIAARNVLPGDSLVFLKKHLSPHGNNAHEVPRYPMLHFTHARCANAAAWTDRGVAATMVAVVIP